MLKESIKSGKITSSLTYWQNNPVLSVVFPLTQRGQVIGMVVLIDPLDKVLSELNESIEGESFFISRNHKQNFALGANKMLSSNLQLPEFKKSISAMVSEKNQFFDLNAISVFDNDAEVGILITKKNITAAVLQSRKYLYIELAICFGMIVIILATINFQIKNALHPLNHIISVVKSLSQGDFTVDFEKKSAGDMAELQDAINRMKEELSGMLKHISQSVADLMGAAQIAEVLEATLRGTGEQQEKVTSLIQTISGIGQSVDSVSDAANVAAEKAQEGNDEARKGDQILSQTVVSIETLANDVSNSSEAISQIEKDSANINDVITLIKNISEQTNLLALNAAIEAARAGEQGRGFAVVADEVRTLAKRTQDSAVEIQDMVESLQENTQSAVLVMGNCLEQAKVCVTEAEHTGVALKHIIGSVASLTELNNQIVHATVNQVNLNSA